MKRNLAVILGFSFLSTWTLAETITTTTTTAPASPTTTTAIPTGPATTQTTQTTTTQPISLADQNLQAGGAFLAANKTQPGVTTLPSGLQYKIIIQGDGPKPTKNDIVTVDYEGKHLNGQIFDSSYQRGQSATFPVSGVIPGWQEALQMMPSGSTWELYIPAHQAYGERGAPGAIGPNETLIFKVHLINVKSGS